MRSGYLSQMAKQLTMAMDAVSRCCDWIGVHGHFPWNCRETMNPAASVTAAAPGSAWDISTGAAGKNLRSCHKLAALSWQRDAIARQWESSSPKNPQVNNVRTVSDTKRAFYRIHTRPISSIYRRVVEELMVEMHLLSVNEDFRYDPIYALGVVTSFDRFMQGYQPEEDRNSIFHALCQSIEHNPQQYRQEAQQWESLAKSLEWQGVVGCLCLETSSGNGSELVALAQGIATNPKFKYSRLFAIGMFTMLQAADPETVKNDKQLADAVAKIAAALKLPEEKIKKDLELYRSNLEKMIQAQNVMADILAADRKKRAERERSAQQGSS